jgi:hypothetical protein
VAAFAVARRTALREVLAAGASGEAVARVEAKRLAPRRVRSSIGQIASEWVCNDDAIAAVRLGRTIARRVQGRALRRSS